MNNDYKNLVMEILEWLDVDDLDYYEWRNIGMALKSDGYPFEVWNDWSRKGIKYNGEEMGYKWDSFKKDGVRGGTITYIAKQHGFTPSKLKNKSKKHFNSPKENTSQKEKKKFKGIKINLNLSELPKFEQPGEDWNPKEDLINFLSALYEPNEIISYVVKNKRKTQKDENGIPQYIDKWEPIQGNNGFYTRDEFINRINECDDIDQVLRVENKNKKGSYLYPYEKSGVWSIINPCDGKGSGDVNITAYKYGLVECDDVSVEEQAEIYKQMNLPIVTLTYSGKRSIHAIIRIDAKDPQEWHDRINYTYDTLEYNGVKVDRNNATLSRLTRLPGVRRNGQKQFLIATNTHAISFEDWQKWLNEHGEKEPLTEDEILLNLVNKNVKESECLREIEKLDGEDAFRILMKRRWFIPKLRKERFLNLMNEKENGQYAKIIENIGLSFSKFEKSFNSKWTESEIIELVNENYDIEYNESIGFYEYDNDYWNKRSETYIKQLITPFCNGIVSGRDLNSLMAFLKTVCVNENLSFNVNEDRDDGKGDLLNFANGTLEIKTGLFRAPRKEDYQAYKLSYNYDPLASAEPVLSFLKDILETDEDIQTLKEYLGYLLFSDCQHETTLFGLGNGSNGKTVLNELLSAVFGDTADKTQTPICICVPFDKMQERFMRAQLNGKRVNLMSEVSESDNGQAKISSDFFKNITSGETILAEEKGKKPFTFKNVAKCIIFLNNLPIFQDYTDATRRRLLILSFAYSFVDNPKLPHEKKKDTTLKTRLITKENLSGFFNWIYEGYHELVKQNHFSRSRNTERELNKYIEDTDVVLQYYLYTDFTKWNYKDGRITNENIYQDFKTYCLDNGFKVTSSQKFHGRFKKVLKDHEDKLPPKETEQGKTKIYTLKEDRFYISTETGKTQKRGYILELLK